MRADIPDGAFIIQRDLRTELNEAWQMGKELGYKPPPRPPLFPPGPRLPFRC